MLNIEEIDLCNQPDEGDPLIWLHKHREEVVRKYPTFEALRDYYKQFSSVEDVLARVRTKITEKKQTK